MAKPKHSVDPSLQPMLFAPSAASLAHGTVVEVEGGGFMPADEVVKLSPEQKASIDRMDSEMYALNHIAAEYMNMGFANASATKLRDLQNDYHQDENEKHPLMERYNKDEANAKAAIFEHRLASKSYFARSIGIEARRVVKKLERNGEVVNNEETGKPEVTIVVEAVNEEERIILDRKYRQFRDEYFGPKKHKKLEGRRKQLGAQVTAIRAVAASAIVSK